MVAPLGCRRPDPEIDWLLFETRRYPPLGADLPAIFVLLDEAAEQYWAAMVDEPNQTIRSYRQVQPGHRLSRLTAFGPNWYTYANDPKLSDHVIEFLRQSLPWFEQQKVFYVHAPRCIFRLPWGVFLRHWRRFMMLDESWVFGLGRPEFALFADAGGLAVGDMLFSSVNSVPRGRTPVCPPDRSPG
jgi:hypothetical protein